MIPHNHKKDRTHSSIVAPNTMSSSCQKKVHQIATEQQCNKVNIQLSVRGLEDVNKERANLALNAGRGVMSFKDPARRSLKWSQPTHTLEHHQQSSLVRVTLQTDST